VFAVTLLRARRRSPATARISPASPAPPAPPGPEPAAP
jgi:hypothetical protein